jgi:hypothetical protein
MKPRIDGSFLWSLLLGFFVVLLLIDARNLPEQVRIAPNLAGYTTLALILVLLAGAFYPAIVRWTEATLQDLWGGGSSSGGGGVGADTDAPIPWPDVIRVMSYAVGFLVLVILFGFFVIPPLFVATYLIREARVKPYIAILVALGASLSLNAAMYSLNVEIWTGAAPEIIEGYIGGEIMPPI